METIGFRLACHSVIDLSIGLDFWETKMVILCSYLGKYTDITLLQYRNFIYQNKLLTNKKKEGKIF